MRECLFKWGSVGWVRKIVEKRKEKIAYPSWKEKKPILKQRLNLQRHTVINIVSGNRHAYDPFLLGALEVVVVAHLAHGCVISFVC